MKLSSDLSDEAVMKQLGERLSALRLARNLTQEALAEQAGLGLRTVQRLELGAVASQLSSFLRVCRVLDVIERLDLLVPEPSPSPIEQLKIRGKERQRAHGKSAAKKTEQPWSWGEPS